MRVLFVSEHATLAQIVRLHALARSLPPDRYDVHFACATFDDLVFHDACFPLHPLFSLPRADIDRAVARGARIYDRATVRRYVDDDLRLFREVRPDVVVGDLRWSLSISAPLANVPCASLANAYWSRFAVRDAFPLPEHPIVDLLGVDRAKKYFPLAFPRVLEHFAAPFDAVRREHRLSPHTSFLDVVTWGDVTLFADIPGLVPLGPSPSHHVTIGHVAWSPSVPVSERMAELGTRRPLVYVTLGSSGAARVLPTVVAALEPLDVDILVATAGRFDGKLSRRAVVERFVDGAWACARARVVVSNGGSSTGYQALAAGRPVLGLPYNLDQYLASEAIVRAGAGLELRSGTARAEEIRAAVVRLLEDPSFSERAQKIAATSRGHDTAARFRAAIDSLAAV